MIIINCMEGLSASSREEEATISHLVLYLVDLFLMSYPTPVVFNEMGSGRTSIDESLKFIKNNFYLGQQQKKLFLVGKSLGGVKTWWMMKSHWGKLRDFVKIACLTIDPYGSILGDNQVGPYDHNSPLGWKEHWDKAIFENQLKIVNLYQHSKFPRGAKWPKANDYEFSKGADHWNITDLESKHSRLTRDMVTECMEWLVRGDE